jgi:hypothetical protein
MIDAIRTCTIRQIERFRKAFLQPSTSPFSELFPASIISPIIAHTPHKRSSVFTPLVTLKAFLFQVLGDDGSCKHAVMGVLSDRLATGKPSNAVGTGSYCKARQRLPLKQLIDAATHVGVGLHQQAQPTWRWKGHNVVLTDGTTLLMPDTVDNQAAFPQPGSQKPGLGFPMARIVGLISLATGGVMDYCLGTYQGKGTGELSLLSQLLGKLSGEDLLLGDRYYCTFALFALLQARGIPALFRLHAQKTADFSQGVCLGSKDHRVDWKKPKRIPVWMSAQDYAALPEMLSIREVSVDGVVYATTLLCHKTYHKQELAKLYQERWKIELDFRSLKTHMGMEMLRCKSPDGVRKEIAVHLLAYNLIRGNLAQAANQHGKIPRELSFRSAVQLITQASGSLVTLVGKLLAEAVSSVLKALTSTPIGRQRRPRQPRAVKRRPKAYPLLTVSRKEAMLSY